MAINLLPFFLHLVIKCGERRVVVVVRVSRQTRWASEEQRSWTVHRIQRKWKRDIVMLEHFPAGDLPPEWIVVVTGTGDTLAASILASLVQNLRRFEDPELLKETVEDAQVAAALTLKSEYTVSPSLSL